MFKNFIDTERAFWRDNHQAREKSVGDVVLENMATRSNPRGRRGRAHSAPIDRERRGYVFAMKERNVIPPRSLEQSVDGAAQEACCRPCRRRHEQRIRLPELLHCYSQ